MSKNDRLPLLEDRLLTVEEAAQAISHSTPCLNSWRRERRGPPFVRLGRRVMYPASRLEAWLQDGLLSGEAR